MDFPSLDMIILPNTTATVPSPAKDQGRNSMIFMSECGVITIPARSQEQNYLAYMALSCSTLGNAG